ncbi:MAG: 50S ribosomal protein L4 [Planctomycetaceae bacterium]|nr:50S ribosomal protein L4 [Planctomycetaceae bacterium]
MISVSIRDMSGAECGTYQLDPASLADGINKQLLHDVVVMYNANKRVGEVQTKSRGMVAGSTRKLFKQKGTGRARAGALRTPVRRGGGHAFGKKPRDYYYRLPRKAVQKATRMALLSKFQDGQAVVLKSWDCVEPRTRVVAGFLKAVGIQGQSVLLATEGLNANVWKSARNIEGVVVMPGSDLNAYSLLRQRNLVITVAEIDRIAGKA